MVYLGLGTNLGNRKYNLDAALQALEGAFIVDVVSAVYETKAWGVTEQPDFLNMCVAGHTGLTPQEFLRFVKDLELQLGREWSARWGPRLIDIDILFWDDTALQEPGLTIPHKDIAERAFVLIPMNDIAPDFVHPVSGLRISQMLAAIDQTGVWLYEGD